MTDDEALRVTSGQNLNTGSDPVEPLFMHSRVQRQYLGLMAALTGAYWLTPPGPVRGTTQLLMATVSVIAVLVGGWGDRSRRLGWCVFGLGLAASVSGDAVAFGYLVADRPLPFPSSADLGYLLGFAVMAAGLALLQRGRPWDVAGLLDAAAMTVGGGMLLWIALGVPVEEGLTAAVAVELGYPVGNILLLAILVWTVTSPVDILERGVVRALALGSAATLIGDMIYGLSSTVLTPQVRWFESFYFVMYTAWGYAALRSGHASRTAPPARGRAPGLLSPVRLIAMYGALLVIPASLLLSLIPDSDVNLPTLVLASTLVSLLVPTRMGVANRQLDLSTRQRDRYREDLQHQAAHDSLTDLPNRAYLLELLTATLHRALRAGEPVAVLFVDLDHFKRVNDTLGHAAGDEVLKVTAQRMLSVLRAGDVLARQGGDEFVVLIDPVPALADLMEIADRLVTAVGAPIMTAAGRAVIGASIGVALARDGEVDAEILLANADLAAYRAKTNGRGRAEIFDAALRAELQARSDHEDRIRAGLAADEFELHYQPVMDVASGRLRGYEALIRWRDPDLGLIQPGDFIPTTEESQLSCEIGRWALNQATRQLARWAEQDPDGHRDVSVAVNISGRHLASRSLIDEVVQALHDSGLPPSQLILEVTETVLLEEPTADAHLRALRDLGVAVSLDDFGTGYHSIGQLQHLPVDTLKIDHSFLHATDPPTMALVHLMISAAHAFGLDVIAEGVETREHLDRLSTYGCELAQGYYLGQPLPPQEIAVNRAHPTPA